MFGSFLVSDNLRRNVQAVEVYLKALCPITKSYLYAFLLKQTNEEMGIRK